ncbi:MAG: carboxypeptidase-like regulatory domain-containing protein [Flavobacteriaceae bacterium]
MPKTLRKALSLFVCLCLLSALTTKAQETAAPTYLIPFIQKLEEDFDIKFSYVDDDLRNVQIMIPNSADLAGILASITDQTQIKIQRISDRYYSMAKSTTVDICATVLDNFEENTVMGATVEVLGSKIAMVTNSEGRFTLQKVPRKAILQIKFLGFKTLFIEAGELIDTNKCKTLLLDPYYQELEEVVVYKFLTTGLTKQTDASILLNSSEFGILPGTIEPDVLQTVQALPGIKSIDETVSDINIRGGSNDQNLLLWDGIKMYQSGHFFGLISAFNPYLTDKVILIKNGSSAQYGDGVSGIIDMHTKNELKDRFFGGAGINLISGDVYGQFPLGNKMALQLSARRSLTDFFNTPTYNEFFDRAFQDSQIVEREGDFYFYDFTGKLLYDIDAKQKLRLSFININNALDYSELSRDMNSATQSSLDQTNLSFGGSLDSEWTKRFTTFVNMYYTRYNLDARNISSDAQQQLFQNNQVKETGLKLNTHFRPNENLNWLNGYQLSETGITNGTNVTAPPFNSNIKGVVRTHSLFSEIGYTSPYRKLFAQLGVRLNYLQNPGNFEKVILEPRLNLNYSFSKVWKVLVLGEFKSQATNQIVDLEQNFLGIEKRRWIISDGVGLPVTRSKQGSVGINYDQEKLYIGLEGFYKEVNGISTATQGFQNQDQFNGEIGKYEVRGIEFLINKKTEQYSIWTSYTYNLNDYTFDDIVPSQFPNNLDIRHTLTLAGTYDIGHLKLGVGLNNRSGKPYTEPLASDPIDSSVFPNRINYDEPNGRRLPEYIRADASAIYDFDLGTGAAATIGISVLNFTDRKNIFNTYYRLNASNEIEKVENISLGLTPNLSFRVRF